MVTSRKVRVMYLAFYMTGEKCFDHSDSEHFKGMFSKYINLSI